MKSSVMPGVRDAEPPIIGYLTTRVMHVEREPLYQDPRGISIGQMVDERLNSLLKPWGDDPAPPGWTQPDIHSVTVELARQD